MDSDSDKEDAEAGTKKESKDQELVYGGRLAGSWMVADTGVLEDEPENEPAVTGAPAVTTDVWDEESDAGAKESKEGVKAPSAAGSPEE
jgi:hypothetical protein